LEDYWEGDFDGYREKYNGLSFEQLQEYNRMWLKCYPEQKFWHKTFLSFLNDCLKDITLYFNRNTLNVMEFGGYNGELAFNILKENPCFSWANIEIIKHKQHEGLELYDYQEYVFSSFLWRKKPNVSNCDVFVSSDALEHITNNEFSELLCYVAENKIKFLVLGIPVKVEGQSWKGYYGSHLLTYGSNAIKEKLEKHGYVLVREQRKPKWESFWKLL